MPQITNFLVNGVEVGTALDWMDKEYVIDNYPEINNVFKQAGLWMWGSSSSGQLGTNSTTNRSSPVQTVFGGGNWKQISCSDGSTPFTAAVKTDGTLWLWGDNSYGQLGNNTRDIKSSPIQTVSTGTNWKSVSCGPDFTGAIKTDRSLWMWGRNNIGQLGDNTTASKSSPVQTVSGGNNWQQVSCGGFHAAAIKTDGTLWSWGEGNYGQMGNNAASFRLSPVQTVSGGTNWKQVDCGNEYTGAIKTDGSLWLWGWNGAGGLGDNTRTNKSSPVQTIALGNNWKQISCGLNSTGSIKTDGTLWVWGTNDYGRLGTNNLTGYSSPVQTVSGGTNWKQIFSAREYTASIKTDGTLWLWGRNNVGQLGDNTRTDRSSPVQTVSGGTNWKQVACGINFTGTIRDDSNDQL